MNEYSAYVGLDVHKDTIAVAVALPGRDEPVYRGEMKNQRKSLLRLIRSLSPHGEVVSLCYEAGPCGYGVYREIIETGHHCEVVAPSLIPRRAGERVKTDRRDALKLARLHRSGELTAVWVPDEEQEAIRDLTRAREDMKAIELKARQRLGAFLLRHGRVYREGKSRWTQKHFRWLEGAEVRASGAAGGVPGIHRYGVGGTHSGGESGGADAPGARRVVTAPGGRGVDRVAGGGLDHGDDGVGGTR